MTPAAARAVPLSETERAAIAAAGTAPEPTVRSRAVAIVLSKSGSDLDEARALLAEGYLETIQPSFHLIPAGEAMAAEQEFESAYEVLAEETACFSDVTAATLAGALDRHPGALAPLRMIIGFTHNELAVAAKLHQPGLRISGGSVKNLERRPRPARSPGRRRKLIEAIAATVLAVMNRKLLDVPPAAAGSFHSKLDKQDTRAGWADVANTARERVPYSGLLYQRYVGGVWRQVQDAYSEVKGDALLETPIARLFESERLPFHQSPPGATGARETESVFGISPGPDFLLPGSAPTVIVESKVGEDGGTVRDKAARIGQLADMGTDRGLVVCAVIDGQGWHQRPTALADVVTATRGRTYSLKTLPHLLNIPEIHALRGTLVSVDPCRLTS